MTNQHPVQLATQRLRSGASQVDVVVELIALGMTREEAKETLFAAEDIVFEEQNSETNSDRWFGIVLLILAVGTIFGLYLQQGIVILPLGLMALGAFLFIRGRARRRQTLR